MNTLRAFIEMFFICLIAGVICACAGPERTLVLPNYHLTLIEEGSLCVPCPTATEDDGSDGKHGSYRRDWFDGRNRRYGHHGTCTVPATGGASCTTCN